MARQFTQTQKGFQNQHKLELQMEVLHLQPDSLLVIWVQTAQAYVWALKMSTLSPCRVMQATQCEQSGGSHKDHQPKNNSKPKINPNT